MKTITRYVRAFPRLLGALVLGVGVAALAPGSIPVETRILLGYATGASSFCVAALIFMRGVDEARMRRNAQRQDLAPWLILIVAVAAAMVGVLAVVAHLKGLSALSGWRKGAQVGLALWAVVAGWTMTHLSFALHYAHEYYRPGRDGREGGLEFPGCARPDYSDFLYFAFVIGVAAQTADVSIHSRALRRVALIQCVTAFFYNLAILGLFVNVAAGLV
jgi:uncharacterized membrane protein